MVRRSALDEVNEGDKSRGSGFLAPGAESVQEGEMPGSDEEVDTAEERRMAIERKRKARRWPLLRLGSHREHLPSRK